MHPSKVDRDRLNKLTDLPNVGPAIAEDLHLLGIHEPRQLEGQSPFQMYERLSEKTGVRQDPCLLDVFISVTRFMNGQEPRLWWEFTTERKKLLSTRGTL
jgi:hypothetical protein